MTMNKMVKPGTGRQEKSGKELKWTDHGKREKMVTFHPLTQIKYT
jgi:hypothetical protein